MLVNGFVEVPEPGGVPFTSTYQVVCAAAGSAKRAATRTRIARELIGVFSRGAGGGDGGPIIHHAARSESGPSFLSVAAHFCSGVATRPTLRITAVGRGGE